MAQVKNFSIIYSQLNRTLKIAKLYYVDCNQPPGDSLNINIFVLTSALFTDVQQLSVSLLVP